MLSIDALHTAMLLPCDVQSAVMSHSLLVHFKVGYDLLVWADRLLASFSIHGSQP